MSNEVLRDENRLKILNLLRLQSGLMFRAVMEGTGFSRSIVGKHLRNLMSEGHVSKDKFRRYHLTENGEKQASLLEELVQHRRWMKGINGSLPKIKVIATRGVATATFEGCDENVIRNIYDRFRNSLHEIRKDGIEVDGFVRFHKTKG